MSNKNVSRRTKFHNFTDTKGKPISYAVLCAVLGESEEWVRTRLKQEKKVPENVHHWIKKILSPGTKKITALKQRQEEAETLIKEEKLREIRFKNERTEGKYGRIDDFQRELDGMLIRLQTNLYSIPEQIIDALMTSRDRTEAKQIFIEALEHHMREISASQIQFGSDDGDA